MFVENKFDAPLGRNQPVSYLEKLKEHPESVLAFVAPEDKLDGLWRDLKESCRNKGLIPAEESPPGDPRWVRVANRTMLIASWRRVLDALHEAAAGRTGIEQDIMQLRGLAEGVIADGV